MYKEVSNNKLAPILSWDASCSFSFIFVPTTSMICFFKLSNSHSALLRFERCVLTIWTVSAACSYPKHTLRHSFAEIFLSFQGHNSSIGNSFWNHTIYKHLLFVRWNCYLGLLSFTLVSDLWIATHISDLFRDRKRLLCKCNKKYPVPHICFQSTVFDQALLIFPLLRFHLVKPTAFSNMDSLFWSSDLLSAFPKFPSIRSLLL